MKAQKVTVNIKLEALSIDCVRGMLAEVLAQIEHEVESGRLAMADGDTIEWEITRQPVEF